MAFLFLILVMAGCSSDNEEVEPPVVGPETPAYLVPGTDARPSWSLPNYRNFEFTMALQIELADTLYSYQTKLDLMCATIGDEVRALTYALNTGGQIFYPLVVAANNPTAHVDLHYYCDSLHRIFTIKDWAEFDPSVPPLGESGIYRPKFTSYFEQ